MKPSLYYFTASYPWGIGETWKRNELERLRHHFGRIVVIPLSDGGNLTRPKVLPAGVEAVTPLFPLGTRLWSTIPRPSPARALIYLRESLRLGRSPTALREVASSAAQIEALLVHPVLSDLLRKADVNTRFLFFWGRGQCEILPWLTGPRGKAIVRMHRYDLFEDQSAIPFRPQLMHAADLIAPSSRAGLVHLTRRYPEAQNRIKTLRLGVERMPEIAPSKDGVFRIISCSYVTPVKRVHLIASAVSKLDFKVHWTHIGDGPEMGRVRQALNELGGNAEVEFPGFVPTDRLAEFYAQRSADCFVNASSSEGIPMSIMEILSAGVPVIATDAGGNGEVVDNSVGMLLPREVEAEQLAEAFRALRCRSPAEGRLLRANAIHRFESECDVDVLTANLARELLS